MLANPYLVFDGKCEEAFRFYAKVFDGAINDMMHYSDTPGMTPPPGRPHDVIHAKMTAGTFVLMGADAPPQHFEKMQGMSICINYDTTPEVESLYHKLSEDAQRTIMPLQPTFWSKAFAMFVDKYGTPWMLGTTERPSN